jgi:heptosyltransferase-2
MATPALRAIRNGNPNATVSVLVRPQVRQIVEGLPFFDEIIEYDSTSRHRGILKKYQLARSLKKKGFSLSIILPNSFSSAVLSFMAGIPQRVGYRTDGRRFLLTQSIPQPTEADEVVPVPMVERYLAICEKLAYPVETRKTALRLANGTRHHVEQLYSELAVDREKGLVTVIPGASFGSSKCWPAEYFAQVCDELINRHEVQIMIVPGPGEEDIARRIESLMRHTAHNCVKKIVSLEELKAIISDSTLVITNDTGPRHYAVALGVPVVVVMGPTDPRYTNYGMEKTKLLRVDLDCSPCHLKECPGDHECMRAIGPERVIEACEELMGKRN